jgi:hypothetical protein
LMDAAQRQQTTPPQFTLTLSPMWTYFGSGWRVLIGLAGLLASRIERSKMEASV